MSRKTEPSISLVYYSIVSSLWIKREISVRTWKCWTYVFKFVFIGLYMPGLLIFRAVADPRNSGISAKSCEIPKKTQKNAKYREIRQKYFQLHVGKTYLILILAIRPVLFTPNVHIYLETSSLQRVNNVPKLTGVLRLMLRKSGH